MRDRASLQIDRKPEIPLLGIYPNRKYLASKVRTFLDFMAEADHACI